MYAQASLTSVVQRLSAAVMLLCLFAVPAGAQQEELYDRESKLFRFNGDYKALMRELHPLAKAGDANAQRDIGTLYDRGLGVERNSVEAVKWFRMSAEQGNSWGQHSLGQMYQIGRGVTKDVDEAMKWFQLSAEQGNIHGQYVLASIYFQRKQAPSDRDKAMKWFREAAEQGHPVAKSILRALENR